MSYTVTVIVPPLAVVYEVLEADRLVEILAVRGAVEHP